MQDNEVLPEAVVGHATKHFLRPLQLLRNEQGRHFVIFCARTFAEYARAHWGPRLDEPRIIAEVSDQGTRAYIRERPNEAKYGQTPWTFSP